MFRFSRTGPALALLAAPIWAQTALAQFVPPPPPDPVMLTCPAKGYATRTVDLSTGLADWRASGPGLADDTRAGRLRADTVPSRWQVGLEGAHWIQAAPDDVAQDMPTGRYRFETAFELRPGKATMRLILKGRALADEHFAVELLDVGPDNPAQGITSDATLSGALRPADVLAFGFVAGETSGTKDARPGRYVLRIGVNNTDLPQPSPALAVGVLAAVEITLTCLDWQQDEISDHSEQAVESSSKETINQEKFAACPISPVRAEDFFDND